MQKENQEEAPKKHLAVFDAKAMLLENGAIERKIFYGSRQTVEIIKETAHYKVGDLVTPHLVKAEALIKQGIAKAIK